MTEEHVKGIFLKVLIDTVNNRVIFAESDEDFVDVLLSFLTMPLGTIIRLIRNKPPIVRIGCLNNLYESIENLDVHRYHTEACKTMLLYPRNAAAAQCKRLKLNIDDGEPLKYFICKRPECILFGYRMLSHYRGAICGCGEDMDYEMGLCEKEPKRRGFDARDRGVFVKGLTRLIISDKLEVMPASTETSLYVLSKLGIMDGNTIEECNRYISEDEVLTLLKCSLVSKAPLTETLWEHNLEPKLGTNAFDQGSCNESRMEEPESNVSEEIHEKRMIIGKSKTKVHYAETDDDFPEANYSLEEPASCFESIVNRGSSTSINLVISKSKNIVYYAEANEDFVDLLFSFLTVPLGYLVKETSGSTSKGCINHLYNSAEEALYLKSFEHKEMLLDPKLAHNFRHENQLLDIDEVINPLYYYAEHHECANNKILTSDKTCIPSEGVFGSTLTVMDPKSEYDEATRGGFVMGSAKFNITDNLIVTPISPVSCLSFLKECSVLSMTLRSVLCVWTMRRRFVYW
ncbi:hypothetical protein LWI29_013700 [Acer saccharum]|uniref:DUF674 family protein n=1 Tax=Acer saccharum TaxID=4024 RepID=A0AA39TFJ0_ACESA|nr:hypothetical protein LWI29_013700 [Acer saccharum]